jgi:hypothetical protein
LLRFEFGFAKLGGGCEGVIILRDAASALLRFEFGFAKLGGV